MEHAQGPPQRLDADRIETLRRWGEGLAGSGRDDEMRAAGRAILLLVDELDALQRDLWHWRANVSDRLPADAADAADAEEPSLLGALRRRIRGGSPLDS